MTQLEGQSDAASVPSTPTDSLPGNSSSQAEKKKAKSLVTRFFTLDTKTNKWHCNPCAAKHVIKVYVNPNDASTGSRLKHLREKHPIIAAEAGLLTEDQIKAKKKHGNIKQMLQGWGGQLDPDELWKLVARYIIENDLPYNTVTKKSFRDICNMIHRGPLRFPSVKKIKAVIDTEYEKRKVSLMNELHDACEILLCFDR